MDRLRYFFAVLIAVVWLGVCAASTVNKELIPLATLVTPVMLLPAGWLFTDGYLRARRGQRDELERGEEAGD